MLVDDLLKLSSAMELTAADLGLPGGDDTPLLDPEASEETQIEVLPDFTEETGYYSVHAAELVRMGFRLGCNFMLVCDTSLLARSGVPDVVLTQHENRQLTIQFDAAYHGYNKPQFDTQGLTVSLSFDALYECTFPWSAIQRVVFFPEIEPVPDEVLSTKPPEPTEPPEPAGKVIPLFK